ncbi:MAG: type II secretion system F family protein [Candidatus Aenigmarchaeota archaeon]|nr:type II secretion system F family protein [Candidatus Aenigmarchaeota archaeon]
MLAKTAVQLFGSIVERYSDNFDRVKLNIKRARLNYNVVQYISMVLFLALLAFPVTFFSFLLFFLLTFQQEGSEAFFFSFSVELAIVLSCIVLVGGYYYPGLKASSIRKEIDRQVPFASFYMTTTASSGINPIEIFRVLSLRKGVIGEEAKKIYTNAKSLGVNLNHAIQKAAENSASPDFADLLWGMSSVITSGGNLEEYLETKTQSLMNTYRRNLNEYAKQLALYTEIYITLIIVGSLFFIILTAIMSPLTGISVLLLQTFLVFFVVPLVSIGFIMLLKNISPTD